MSQGADVSWLSQFPGENERLFPPWTHLQVCAYIFSRRIYIFQEKTSVCSHLGHICRYVHIYFPGEYIFSRRKRASVPTLDTFAGMCFFLKEKRKEKKEKTFMKTSVCSHLGHICRYVHIYIGVF
jgi:hypothetical protein